MEQAFTEATATLDVGTRLGDRDLQALGLHQQGVVLVAQGKADEGLALLEEAAVPAVSGELDPSSTATIYCNVISTCRDLRLPARRRVDRGRETLVRTTGDSGFPEIAGVFIGQRSCGGVALGRRPRTRWTALARSSAAYSPTFAGEGSVELGEIRLRMGDFVTAREAFQMAEGLGATPQPGLPCSTWPRAISAPPPLAYWARWRRTHGTACASRLLPRVSSCTRCRRHGDRSRLGR